MYLHKKKRAIKRALKLTPKTQPKELVKNIGDYWSNYYTTVRTTKMGWWERDLIKRHINLLVDNVDSPIQSEGLNQLLLKKLDGRHIFINKE